jgi:hypothetical protein
MLHAHSLICTHGIDSYYSRIINVAEGGREGRGRAGLRYMNRCFDAELDNVNKQALETIYMVLGGSYIRN